MSFSRQCALVILATAVLGAIPDLPASAEETFALERMQTARAAFEKECRKCHTIKYALNEVKDRDDWKLTVSMMVSNGAELSDDQRTLIVDYLTAKSLFETKCSVCHGLERSLSVSKSPEQWEATVIRMGSKGADLLAESDVSAIAAYLSLERPAP